LGLGILWSAYSTYKKGFKISEGKRIEGRAAGVVSVILFAVGIGPTGQGGFGLTVAPDLHAPRLTAEQAADVMARAHQRCPYSIATCANIDVELSVGGVLLPTGAKLACGISRSDGST